MSFRARAVASAKSEEVRPAPTRLHFVGIGGSGVSALALVALSQVRVDPHLFGLCYHLTFQHWTGLRRFRVRLEGKCAVGACPSRGKYITSLLQNVIVLEVSDVSRK